MIRLSERRRKTPADRRQDAVCFLVNEPTCTWRNDWYEGWWTSCEISPRSELLPPIEQGLNYCPWCGGKIIEEHPEEVT